MLLVRYDATSSLLAVNKVSRAASQQKYKCRMGFVCLQSSVGNYVRLRSSSNRIRVSILKPSALSLRVCVGLFIFGFLIVTDARHVIAEEPVKQEEAKWIRLFDGTSMKDWKATQFGGEGDVYVEDHAMVLEYGSSLTGVTYEGTPPAGEYELRLEAKRMAGIDFFCGLTFPVGESHCSLILGGWGGAIVGLSSIDGVDASENETQLIQAFEKDRWYRVRLRVTEEAIVVWLDDKQIISQKRVGKVFSIRPEVELCRPLGICTWDTKGAIREVEYRKLND